MCITEDCFFSITTIINTIYDQAGNTCPTRTLMNDISSLSKWGFEVYIYTFQPLFINLELALAVILLCQGMISFYYKLILLFINK